jgi:hypothetical protein
MVRRPKLVAVRFTAEELAELDAVLDSRSDRSHFIRAAVRARIDAGKKLAGNGRLDSRALGDNEIIRGDPPKENAGPSAPIRMPRRIHTNASGQTFPGAPYSMPPPSGRSATAKGRARKERTCKHGTLEGWNCGLCGGLAVIE